MLESVVECLVKRNLTPKAAAGRAGMIFLDVVILVACYIIAFAVPPVIFILIFPIVLGGVFTYVVFKKTDVEFEYAFFDGELTIDKIMSKNSRKRVAVFDLGKMEVMAPVGSSHIRNGNGEHKIVDYTSYDDSHLRYSIITYDSKNTVVELRIEPNEELLNSLKNHYSRKIYSE